MSEANGVVAIVVGVLVGALVGVAGGGVYGLLVAMALGFGLYVAMKHDKDGPGHGAA